MQRPVQQSDVDEFRIRAGDEECSRPFHVDAGGSGRSQSAVAQHHKVLASRVARTCVFKDFVGLKIHEPHAHGAAPEDSFQMAAASAAAENFLGVEGDDGVPAFPDSFAGREAAKTDAVTKRPDANERVQLALRGRDSRGHHVGVVENTNLRSRELAAYRGGKGSLKGKAFGWL